MASHCCSPFTCFPMCPLARPRPEIDLYWTNEKIISALEYKPESHLPDNMLADLSPYQHPPSSLPGGIWFLAHSDEKKESGYGFWIAREEACKVYSDIMINGWRNTLEFFEGMAPHGQITDWPMEEHQITQKELSDKDKPKDSRLLCKAFLCNGHSSKSEMNPQNCNNVFEPKTIDPAVSIINPIASFTSEEDSRSEYEGKWELELGEFPIGGDTNPNSPLRDFCELGCFLGDAYLELNDLEDPEPHSSNSENSSCITELSDEYFDSSAFLRDLEEEVNSNNNIQGQQSSSVYNFITPVVPNAMVLQPGISGSVMSGSVIADGIEASRTSSSADDSLTDERVQKHSTKRPNPENKTECTSNFYGVGVPSASPDGEMRVDEGKMKKLKTYSCFSSF